MSLIILIIIAYLLGSIPFGLLISKMKGVDIRKVGSGNIGGTNVARVLGLKWGALSGILDFLKGAFSAYLAVKFLNPCLCLERDWQVVLVSLAPVLGHTFPVWLKFKGGKGVAATFGVLLILLSWKLFLLWIFFWIVILSISKIMSFTNLLMASFLPLFLWFSSFSFAYFALGIFLFGFIWWTHRENLKRMKKGTESKLSFGSKS